MKKSLFIFALLMNFQTDVLSDENNYLFKQKKILPANEVFVISTKNENNKIYVEWRIRENYYLYFDSIKKGSIDKIEEIEKNRRNIHNEGALLVLEQVGRIFLTDFP